MIDMYALNWQLYRLFGVVLGVSILLFWIKVGVDYEFLPLKCRRMYARIFYREAEG